MTDMETKVLHVMRRRQQLGLVTGAPVLLTRMTLVPIMDPRATHHPNRSPPMIDPTETTIAHAKGGLALDVFSARALRAAKKALRAAWPVRRIISEREAYKLVEAAVARIDEELNARELDNRLAPRAQRTRGFKV